MTRSGTLRTGGSIASYRRGYCCRAAPRLGGERHGGDGLADSEARLGAPGVSVPTIPRAAVQNVGARTVVYLVDPRESGKFVERDVRLGDVAGDSVAVATW